MKTLIIITISLVVIYAFYKTVQIKNIDKDLDKLIENGAIVLDVRTTSEYEGGHIEGSLNISLGTIRERYTELDTNKTYITCCSHGLRSIKVESILKEKGFKHVYNGGTWTDLEKIVKSNRGIK
jgi:phage shock protein E